MQLKHAIWEQFDYYTQKQNKVLYINMENIMDFLPPTAPQPRFRDLHALFRQLFLF